MEIKSKEMTTPYLLNVGLATSPLAGPAGSRGATLLAVAHRAAVGHGALFGSGLCVLLASCSLDLPAQVGSELAVLLGGLAQPVLENPVVPAVKDKSVCNLSDIVGNRRDSDRDDQNQWTLCKGPE